MRPTAPRSLANLMVCLALAACSVQLPKFGDGSNIDPQAESMLRSGDYDGARQRYEILARTARIPDYYWLRAADSAFRGGDAQTAQQLVDAIHPDELEGVDRNQYLLLASRLDLAAGRARQAMAKLNSVPADTLEGGQAVNYHTARSSAYNQLGDMYASAKERIILGTLLRSPESITKNNQAIYDALSRLTVQQLQSKRQVKPDFLDGWVSLCLLLKTTTKDQRLSEVNKWQREYPRHPANGIFIENILSADSMDISAGKSSSGKASLEKTKTVAPGSSQINSMATLPITPFVGVMLPLTGPYAPAAQAIKTGMEAAYFADTRASKPKLHFVDTQSSDVHEIYRRLVDGGAISIIGPLVKEDVARLANSSDINVTVLALNQVQGATNANLFQFGLTPEHEVEQAAGSAWFDGRQNALVLAPDSSFGQRMVKHFSAYWKSLGGRVITVKTYPHHGSEFTSTVNGLLAGVSPMDIGAANFVFLIADAHDARLMMPQLKISAGESLPVYALSHVYSGKTNVNLDKDLSGIVFCDVPWLLNPNEGGNLSVQMLESQIERTPPEYVKLIAMGVDAYRLGSELDRFRSDPLYRFNGQTGNLALLSGNRFQRQLECAQFENGKLQVRGQAPILEPTTPPMNYSR